MVDHDRPNYAPEIKLALTDVRRVCDALGLTADGGNSVRRQASGLLVRCPAHADKTPSCSVQLREGEILWHCHGCDAGGDVLSLIAAVRGMSLRGRGFRDVLVEGARLAGLWQIVAALEGRGPAPEVQPPPARTAPSEPEREYPPIAEVESLWNACVPVTADADAVRVLSGRALTPELVEARDLARCVPTVGSLPRWAICIGGNWREAGYRIVVPVYDHEGTMRSLRCWRVVVGDGPKRLPPYGHKASGLVMADEFGVAMLRGARSPEKVCIVEGEPDMLSRSIVSNDPSLAVIGIVSGSWNEQIANRLPIGARVVIRTDHDQAGDRYAREIVASLERRCFTYRSAKEGTNDA